jgi:poly-gamma-glutamate synthesis protein (capsule biosynthesis protein)
MITIAAVGDIMPGGILAGVDDGYASKEVLDVLNKADVRVGTLETAIGNAPTFYEEKMKRMADVIYAQDHDLIKLQQLSINIVSLANNHFFDLGPEGAEHTIQLLDEMGIKHIGAGRNLEEAQRPVVETINEKKVAFLAFCDWRNETVGWCPFATEDQPGVNPMYDDYVVDEIKKYKAQSDYVVVMPHWGKEHTWVTTNHVYAMAKKMRKAGADLILGSHPHRVQPVVNYKHASVAYSMGNFLFPDRLIIKPRSTYYPENPIDLSALPVTDAYPYVEEITYKKWKPLARIGMIVTSSLSDNTVSSSYDLTIMGEDGKLLMKKDTDIIDCTLRRREKMLKTGIYSLVFQIERYGGKVLRKLHLLKNN